MWGQKPDARSEERLIEDGGMKERRDRKRELQPSPSVPWQLFQMLAKMGLNNMSDGLPFVRMEPSCCCLPRPPTLVRLSLLLSPSTDLSSHLLSVLYFKGGFEKKKRKRSKHRDICIEMFYSENIIDGMQWGRDGRGSKETSAMAHGGKVMGLARASPNSSPSKPMTVRKRGRRC